MGYTKQALFGFSGQSFLKVMTYGLAVGRVFVLTRLLTPDDYGLFSLTMIALGVSEALTQTGINLTMLQAKQSVSYFVDTAWVIAIVRGFIISAAMILLGFGLTRYFNQPDLLFLITWVSLVPIVKGFINPAIVGMQKELRFTADTLFRLAVLVVETLSIIVLVYVFRSVFAWLSGFIISALFEVLISFLFVKPRPRFVYHASRAKVIFEKAKGFSIQALLGYLSENMDNLIIGKINGVFALGLYQPTYSVSHAINYDVAKSVNHGTLPIYTKILDEPKRLKRAFSKAAISTALVSLLTSLPFILMPEVVVRLLLGKDWAGATHLLPWLVVAGWIQALFMIAYTFLLAKNKVTQMNQHMALAFGLMVLSLGVLGTRFGITGAVIGLVISRALTLPLLAWYIKKEFIS